MTDLTIRIREGDLLRMIGWLLTGIALYGASIAVGAAYPQAQVILQKLGNVTMFGYVGYWVSRSALGRIDRDDSYDNNEPFRMIARGIIIGCSVLAGALGL